MNEIGFPRLNIIIEFRKTGFYVAHDFRVPSEVSSHPVPQLDSHSNTFFCFGKCAIVCDGAVRRGRRAGNRSWGLEEGGGRYVSAVAAVGDARNADDLQMPSAPPQRPHLASSHAYGHRCLMPPLFDVVLPLLTLNELSILRMAFYNASVRTSDKFFGV